MKRVWGRKGQRLRDSLSRMKRAWGMKSLRFEDLI